MRTKGKTVFAAPPHLYGDGIRDNLGVPPPHLSAQCSSECHTPKGPKVKQKYAQPSKQSSYTELFSGSARMGATPLRV